MTDPSQTDDTASTRDGDATSEAAAPPRSGDPSVWEWWVCVAIVLAILFAGAWGVVWTRLGDVSLYTHVFGLPVLGGLTLPVALWGVMRTVFRPPLFRWRRAVGFGLLLTVAFFGNVPLFAVPLSTQDWTPDRRYRLPFEGTWYTLAGGPSVDRNYHATTAPYRWGYDFAPVSETGKRYQGEGESLEDYYCYGKPVLAPVSGEVVRFEDDRKDMPPGEFDSGSVLGNHVVLRVDSDVYLVVAQLAKGSIPVEPGASVERGRKLGECGNSGRALEPHVHVHLQDRPDFPVAQSLPLRFSNYQADGSSIELGMPRGEGEGGTPKGERVEYVGSR